MGSWNATCALSNLPILYGDQCVSLILTRNPYNNGRTQGNYHNSFWFVRSIPLFGSYDDYGRMEWSGEEGAIIKSIEEQFKLDLLRQRCEARDEEVRETNYNSLLGFFESGEVSVKDPSVYHFFEHYFPLYEKTVQEYGLTEEETFKGGVGKKLPNFEERQQRNLVRRQGQRYLYRDKALPCALVFIHKGVWDSFCEFRYENWSDNSLTGLKERRADAKEFLSSLQKEFQERPLDRSYTNSPSEYLRYVIRGCMGAKDNPFVRLLGGGECNTPPFHSGPETALEALLCSNGFNTEDPAVLLLVDRICQLSVIEYFLAKTRRAWFPTTGAGSQSENYKEHTEYYIRCAKQAILAYQSKCASFQAENRDMYSKSDLKEFRKEEQCMEKLIESLSEVSASTPTPKTKQKSKPRKSK